MTCINVVIYVMALFIVSYFFIENALQRVTRRYEVLQAVTKNQRLGSSDASDDVLNALKLLFLLIALQSVLRRYKRLQSVINCYKKSKTRIE